MPAPLELKRTLGLRDLALFYVVSSLSVRWTATAAAAGPSILLIWVAALSCFFVPLAASVMELSSRYPEEGGIYIWTREAFGDFWGFLSAWAYWMSNLPYFPGVLYFGAASVLFAFGPHAQALAASPLYFVSFAVACLALITGLNILGVNQGKWLNNVSSLGSLLPLTVIIALGAVSYARFGAAAHFTSAGLAPHWSLKNAIFWSTVFFAFGGVEAGSAMGDEIRNPRRTIPLAILIGGIVLTIGYIAGTAALLVALPSQAVAGPDGFVNGVRALSTHLGVAWLLAPMALLVGLNAVGGPAAYLSSTSRLPFVAGIDRYLPAAFGKIHPRFRTPWVAIGVYGLAGMGMALLGQAGTTVRGAYDALISWTVLTYFIPYLFLFAAMIRVQTRVQTGERGPDAKQRDADRPRNGSIRRVPGGRPVGLVLGAVGLASTALTIVLSVIPTDNPNPVLAMAKTIGGTVVLLGAGVVVFALGARSKRRLEQNSIAR
jgi:glutamate:GABA antiporter